MQYTHMKQVKVLKHTNTVAWIKTNSYMVKIQQKNINKIPAVKTKKCRN